MVRELRWLDQIEFVRQIISLLMLSMFGQYSSRDHDTLYDAYGTPMVYGWLTNARNTSGGGEREIR